MNDILIALISILGTAGIFIFLIIYFVMNPDKFDKWVAIVLRFVDFLGFKIKRQQIKKDIQGSINSYAKRLARDSNINTPGVKIKWAGRFEDDDVRWKDGEVVLVLKDRSHRMRNFVHAAYLFTSTTLLRHVKTHLSKKQATAIDLFTTGKIVEEENPPALDYYNKDIANPLLLDEKIKESVEKFEDIDKSGFYTHILLQELNYLGSKVVFSSRKGEVYEEVSSLINFLQNFATREVGDKSITEEFVGKFLRSSIKIVATQYVRERDDAQGPSDRIRAAFDRGIENVYVIGPHEDGKDFIKKVCSVVTMKNSKVLIVCSKTFKGVTTKKGRTTPTITYMIQLQNRKYRKFIEPKDVQKQIEEYKMELLEDQKS